MPVATVEQFWDLLSAARLQSADDITALRRDDSAATSEQDCTQIGRTRFFLILAARHLEDARMRLGKAIQAHDDGGCRPLPD